MKKKFLLTTFITVMALASCGEKPASKNDPIARDWTNDQIAIFNEHLNGYILPSLNYKPNSFRYFLGSIVIDYDYVENIDLTYSEILTKDKFKVSYEPTYLAYTASKVMSDGGTVYVDFAADLESKDKSFQISTHYQEKEKEREHVWTSEEKKIFEDHLENTVLPFPDASHASIRYTNYSTNNYVYITSDYNETVLSKYLTEVKKLGFKMGKHPSYEIDVAYKQFTNNRYIELWIAVADERSYGGGIFFEVYGYVRSGNIYIIDEQHVTFGSYPQKKVETNVALYSKLLKLVGDYPEEGNPKGWNVFSDYYVDYKQENYAFYKDVTYEGRKFRGIYYTKPRTGAVSGTFDDEFAVYYCLLNGYQCSTVYFFEFEPIIWRILKNDNGIKMMVPTSVLDMQYFSNSSEMYLDGETKVYPNNYKYSMIRSWINDEFLNSAFSSSEQAKIQLTTVDNSIEQCSLSENEIDDLNREIKYWETQGVTLDYESYICENTEDKVFLLSRKDLLTYNFGYKSIEDWQNIDKDYACLPSSDYACARGAYVSILTEVKKTIYCRACNFITRSPFLATIDGHLTYNTAWEYGLNYAYTNPITCSGVYPGINVKF